MIHRNQNDRIERINQYGSNKTSISIPDPRRVEIVMDATTNNLEIGVRPEQHFDVRPKNEKRNERVSDVQPLH